MKRRFDKARAYHRKVFVRFRHHSGVFVCRTITRKRNSTHFSDTVDRAA